MKTNSPQFKRLQAKWDLKLSEAGFKDIEYRTHEGLRGNMELEMKKSTFNVGVQLCKQEYYRLAGQFLHSNKFKSEADRLIWQYHCDGTAMTMISYLLKQAGHNTDKNKVNLKIKAFAKEMVNVWSPTEV